MPPKTKAPQKGGKPPKKEKVFHPDSRKAGQLARKALRKGKLGNLRTKRSHKASSMLELYTFFHAALPPPAVPESDVDPGADPTEALTLPELHALARAWVARNDGVLAEEQAARRKGRPKSAREVRIEELRLREQGDLSHRHGCVRRPLFCSIFHSTLSSICIEIPDLTDPVTLARFRKWDVKSLGYAHLLRFVRISSALPDTIVLARADSGRGGRGG
ncbi:hypothetical protein MVEN_01001000 [Mycena venus]|uniref:Uncharacterized protein n=1 Tax=Mycena venus TaxID=2733690 RepID=A0A8H7D057_9AGAR|nr:hypothetical protein MVEN_01001000 [Mycena venus]